MFYRLLILVFFGSLCWSPAASHAIRKRASFYLANETMCIVDGDVYRNGDPVPTDDECERCTCRPPGFSCVLRDCDTKPGCKAVRRAGECCPEYVCGCVHNSRLYEDGELIKDLQNNCYTCRCHGSSISCTFADCHFRSDCPPEYIPGECCPRYDHCPPISTTTTTTTTTTPVIQQEIEFINMTTQHLEKFTSAATTVSIEDISVSEHTTPGDIFTVKFTLTGEKISSIHDHDITVLMTVLPVETTTYTETTKHVFVPSGTELTTLKDGLIVRDFDKATTGILHDTTLKTETIAETDSSDYSSSTIHSSDIFEMKSTTDSHDTSTESSDGVEKDEVESVAQYEITTISQAAESFIPVSESNLPTEKQSELPQHSIFTAEFEISKETLDQQSSFLENRTDIPSYTHEITTDFDHTSAVTYKIPTTESPASLSTDESKEDYSEEIYLAPKTTNSSVTYETYSTSKFSQYDLQTSSDELHTFSTALLPQTTERIKTDEKTDSLKISEELDHATTGEEFIHFDHERDQDKETTYPIEKINDERDELAITGTQKTTINLDETTEINLHHDYDIITTDSSDSQSTSGSPEISDISKDAIGITSYQFKTISLLTSEELESSTLESLKDLNETSFPSAVESHTPLYTDKVLNEGGTNNINIGISDDSTYDNQSTINVLHELSDRKTTETPLTTAKTYESTYEYSGSSSDYEESFAAEISSIKDIFKSSNGYSTSPFGIETTPSSFSTLTYDDDTQKKNNHTIKFNETDTDSTDEHFTISSQPNTYSTFDEFSVSMEFDTSVNDKSTNFYDAESDHTEDFGNANNKTTNISAETFQSSNDTSLSEASKQESTISTIFVDKKTFESNIISNNAKDEDVENQEITTITSTTFKDSLSNYTFPNEDFEVSIALISENKTKIITLPPTPEESILNETEAKNQNEYSKSSTNLATENHLSGETITAGTNENIDTTVSFLKYDFTYTDDSTNLGISKLTTDTLPPSSTSAISSLDPYIGESTARVPDTVSAQDSETSVKVEESTSVVSKPTVSHHYQNISEKVKYEASSSKEETLLVTIVSEQTTEFTVDKSDNEGISSSTSSDIMLESITTKQSFHSTTQKIKEADDEIVQVKSGAEGFSVHVPNTGLPISTEISTVGISTEKISTTPENDFPSELPAFEPPLANILKQQMLFNKPTVDKENVSISEESDESQNMKFNFTGDLSEKNDLEKLSLTVLENGEISDNASLIQDESADQIFVLNHEYTIPESEINVFSVPETDERRNTPVKTGDSVHWLHTKSSVEASVNDTAQTETNPPTNFIAINTIYNSENETLSPNIEIIDSEELDDVKDNSDHDVTSIIPKDLDNLPDDLEIHKLSLTEKISNVVNLQVADDDLMKDKLETISPHESHTNNATDVSDFDNIRSNNTKEIASVSDLDITDVSERKSVTSTETNGEGYWTTSLYTKYISHSANNSSLFINNDGNKIEKEFNKIDVSISDSLDTDFVSSVSIVEEENNSHYLQHNQHESTESVHKEANTSENLDVLDEKLTTVTASEMHHKFGTSFLDTSLILSPNAAINDILHNNDKLDPESNFENNQHNTTMTIDVLFGKDSPGTSQVKEIVNLLSGSNVEYSSNSDTATLEGNKYDLITIGSHDISSEDKFLENNTTDDASKIITKEYETTSISISPTTILEYLGDLFSGVNTFSTVSDDSKLLANNETESSGVKEESKIFGDTIGSKDKNASAPSNQTYSNFLKEQYTGYGSLGSVFITGKSKYNGSFSVEQNQNLVPSVLITLTNDTVSENESESRSSNKTNLVQHMSTNENDHDIILEAEEDYSVTDSSKNVKNIIEIESITIESADEFLSINEKNKKENSSNQEETLNSEIFSTLDPLLVLSPIQFSPEDFENKSTMTSVNDLETYVSEKDTVLSTMNTNDVFAIVSQEHFATTTINDLSQGGIDTEEETVPEKGEVFEPAFTDVPPIDNINLEIERDSTALHHNSEVHPELTNVTGESHGPEKGGEVFEPVFPDLFPFDSVNLEAESDTTTLYDDSNKNHESTNAYSESHGTEKGVFETAFPMTGAESEVSSSTSNPIIEAQNMSLTSGDVLIKYSNSTKLLDDESEINSEAGISNGFKLEFIPPLPILLKDFNKIVQNNLSRDSLNNSDNFDESKKLNADSEEDYLSDEESIQLPSKITSRRNLDYPYHLSDIISQVFKAPGYDTEVLGYSPESSSFENAKILRIKREAENLSKISTASDSASPSNETPITEYTGLSHVFKSNNVLLVEGYGKKSGGFFPITSSVIIVHSDEENETDPKQNSRGKVDEIKSEGDFSAIEFVDGIPENSEKDAESHSAV